MKANNMNPDQSNPKRANIFKSATYIREHFRLDFFMEANNMSPDQTAEFPDYFPDQLAPSTKERSI